MSEPRSFLDGRISLHAGDCLDVLKTLPDNSIDSCVTDPPYALVSIVKRFGSANAAPQKGDHAGGAYARASRGFMGKAWDVGDRAFAIELWAEVFRVLKPGAHVVAFGGTRTFHRLVCAIEDAGFEVRDQIAWLYGAGFPKSHNVARGIDKMRGVVGETTEGASGKGASTINAFGDGLNVNFQARPAYASASDEAKQWEGWGSALKPALEPICLARKPLSEKSIAANVLRWGTGAINVDGCRVEGAPRTTHADGNRVTSVAASGHLAGKQPHGPTPAPEGRFPANLVLSYPEDTYALRRDITSEQKRELYRWLSENA